MNLDEYRRALADGTLEPPKRDVAKLQAWNANLRAEEKFDAHGRAIESTSLSPDVELAGIPRAIFRCSAGHESLIRTRRNLAVCAMKKCNLRTRRVAEYDDV